MKQPRSSHPRRLFRSATPRGTAVQPLGSGRIDRRSLTNLRNLLRSATRPQLRSISPPNNYPDKKGGLVI
jgi:hypothetical protein